MAGTGESLSAAASAEPASEHAGTAAKPRKRILVVDDHRDAARVLGLLLDSLGHEVQTATDGQQALATMSAFHPDIVFLDIGLPEIDGYEVARRVRKSPELRGTKLIALTGWSHAEDRARTREAGFDHHLVKPVGVKTLKEVLAQA
jgi:CheY-like chemotaxis protein